MDLTQRTDTDLFLDHAIARERHSEHFANVECGIGDEVTEARLRDESFEALAPLANELRSRGYTLRHDDSSPTGGPE